MQIAVGGCLAQKDKNVILEKAPWVDVVFGTHNMGSLPSLLERARHNDEAQLEILESLEVFPSTLPTKRDSTYSGWVSISVGCNNTCTFCIVPALRGKEKDRRPGDILAEIQALVDDGAIEVTLLGQNVNSYGVEFGDRQAFGKLLRAAGAIDGLERIRFTSPHPAAFTDDVIDAMAETPTVMPQLHMPLQSGSDRILKAMRRSYRSEKFLGILDRVRDRIPNAAITTDIIVGFPGETEEDFQETLRVVEQARFASAFTFQYSIRPGTPAATMDDQVPKEVVQERYERLIALQERISWEENQQLVGRPVEVLVSTGEGKKDAETHRLSGRAEDSRLVHFEVPRAPTCRAPATSSRVDDHPGGAVPPDRRLARRCAAAHPPHARGRRVGSRRGRELRRPGRPRGIRYRPRVARPAHAAGPRHRAARRPASAPCRSTTRATRSADVTLIAIVGATGTGKSDFALDLAERVRARGSRRRDRQRRRHAAVPRHGHRHGEAPARRAPRHPAPPARRARRHRGGVASPRYQPSARAAIDDIVARDGGRAPRRRLGPVRLVASSTTSGSRARMPRSARGSRPSSPSSARALLHARLALDRPRDRRERSDAQNGRRIVRALEVIELTGEPYGGAPARRARAVAPAPRSSRLRSDRARLVERLDARVRSACGATGCSTRCATLRPARPRRGVTARRAIGYAQALAELHGRMPRGRGDRADRSSSPAATPDGR